MAAISSRLPSLRQLCAAGFFCSRTMGSLEDFPVPPIWWDRQDQFMKYFVFSDANYNTRAFSFADQKSIKKVEKETKK